MVNRNDTGGNWLTVLNDCVHDHLLTLIIAAQFPLFFNLFISGSLNFDPKIYRGYINSKTIYNNK